MTGRWKLAIAEIGVLAVAITFCYWPALDGQFLWDDNRIYIGQNDLLSESDGVYYYFFSTETIDYFPLAYTSFWLEWRLWGSDPIGYHVVNLVLHFGCVLLLLRILRQWEIPGAFWCALWFAVHPVNVETVAWISQRKTLLASLFFFIALSAYLRFKRSGRRAIYTWSLTAYLLGMLAKQSIAPLPAILLGEAWWRDRRVGWRQVWGMAPFFVFGGILTAVGAWFQKYNVVGSEVVRSDGWLPRILGVGWSFWFYLSKIFWPSDLAFIYPLWRIDPTAASAYVPLVAMIGVFAVAYRYRDKWGRDLLAALGFFVLMLAPVLGLVDVYLFKFSLVADHYQYVAMLGPLAWTASLLPTMADGLRGNPWRNGAVRHLLPAGVALLLALVSHRQARVYENEITLLLDTVEKNPSAWVAHHNLGILYWHAEQPELARDALQRGFRLNPRRGDAYYQLGIAQRMMGERDEAIASLRQAVAEEPEYAVAYRMLGATHFEQGQIEEAIDSYRRSLALYDRDVAIWRELGDIYSVAGRVDEAIDTYHEVLRRVPRHWIVGLSLAQHLDNRGQCEQAAEHYRGVLWRQPRHPQAANNLAWILATHPDPKLRSPAEAVRWGEIACAETEFEQPAFLDTLAAAYAAQGRFDEAIRLVRQALKLVGDTDPTARTVLMGREALYRNRQPVVDVRASQESETSSKRPTGSGLSTQ